MMAEFFCIFPAQNTPTKAILGIFPAKITVIVKQVYPIVKHPALQ